MNRFFVDKCDIDGDAAVIRGDDAAHITKVLRLRGGDVVMLCDGENHEYAAEIESVERDRVTLKVQSVADCTSEPPCEISLFQGVPKAGKLDTIIQKCVELGVSIITPVQMERSVAKMEKKDAGKLVRLQRIAYEAAKQSRRGIIPKIGEPCELCDIPYPDFDLVLMAYEDEKLHSLKSVIGAMKLNGKRIALIIGPEGGFSESEAEYLKKVGAISVSLGRRILRTETAGMAMAAMLIYVAEGEL